MTSPTPLPKQGEAMNTLLSDEELRKKPQDELEQILSDMAFRCAGGITHSGRKEYMPAKHEIERLVCRDCGIKEELGQQYGYRNCRKRVRHDNI